MSRRYRGFFMMEVLVGMVLLIALGIALAVTLHMRELVTNRMRAKSRAIDLAESALIAVRYDRPVPAGVKISNLTKTADGQWVQAHATVEDTSADLVALIPARSGGAQ